MKKNTQSKRIDKELSRLAREIEAEIEEERRAAEAGAAPDADMLFDDDDFDDLIDDEELDMELDDEDFDDEDFDDEDFDDEDFDDEDFDDEDFDDEDLLDDGESGGKKKGGTGAIVAVMIVLIVLLAGGAALWFMTETRDIGFEATQYAIRVGETQPIQPVFTPKFARNKNYTLVSSDGEVLTFTDGTVTGMKTGTVTLTAVQNGNEYGSCTITVLPVLAKEIFFSEMPEQLYVGDTLEPAVTFLPENVTDPAVEYTVSDTEMAAVENGAITFTGAGEVTITATETQSGVSVEHTLTVIPIDPEQIIINAPEMIELSDTAVVTISFVPELVADTGIVWSSSDASVFTVENGTIIPHATGSAMLIATHTSGLYENKGIDIVPVQGREVTIESDFGDTLAIKAKKTLTVSVSPEEAADKAVTWASSDESVVTVSNKGVVTAKAAGEAEITATLKNGIKGTMKITVPPKAVSQKKGFVVKPRAKTKTAVTMSAPENRNLYIAFRSTDGDEKKSFTVYVPEGTELRTKLPDGSYYVTITIGETWYGDKVWFYTEGEYFALKEVFEVTAEAKLDCTMPGADDAFEHVTAADFGG